MAHAADPSKLREVLHTPRDVLPWVDLHASPLATMVHHGVRAPFDSPVSG